jgi:hypothetical protein
MKQREHNIESFLISRSTDYRTPGTDLARVLAHREHHYELKNSLQE